MRDRPALRIGDAEREGAVVLLREHHVAGRLDVLEFQQRMTWALQAKTAEDLRPLFADLPRLRPPRVVRQHPRARRVRVRRGVALALGAVSLAANGILFAVLSEADEYRGDATPADNVYRSVDDGEQADLAPAP